MKGILLFFNFFLAIMILSCGTARQKTLPAEEMKELNEKKAGLPPNDAFLSGLLSSHPQLFDEIIRNPDKYRVQIIYTQIDRERDNEPNFTNHYYNIDPDNYFYPASTVKLPVALLALQRLNELAITGLDRNSTMVTEAAYPGQTPMYNDPTAEDGRPTVAHYVKKILLTSDNDAYNRLYEFLGQPYINNNLHRMGYPSAQIVHRLEVAMDEEQHRHANPVAFYDTAGKQLYSQPLNRSNLVYHSRNTLMGKGFMRNGRLVDAPFDFSKKNLLTLVDLHSILRAALFPETVKKEQRFGLTEEDYRFLYRHMSMLPRESGFPSYDTSFHDAYVKFLLFGGSGSIEDTSLRIFNKVGDAYGFLTDAAYIVNFEKGIEFMLSATIYCNSDEIFNDNQYDYQTVGFPFLKNLGRLLYEHELSRSRKNRPDLTRYQFFSGPSF